MERLEKIVEQLEQGQMPLDESLEMFEEAVRLSRLCNARLEEIEKKIEILTKEDGEMKAVPFEESSEEAPE
jgi:exodeoxyribonuclease VII small subunit